MIDAMYAALSDKYLWQAFFIIWLVMLSFGVALGVVVGFMRVIDRLAR